jgi:hypothetical protein
LESRTLPLRFNAILAQFGIAPAAVRLLRHQDKRADKGRTPYELWRDDPPSFERYQGSHRKTNRTRLRADYWASFVVGSDDKTLLAGFYKSAYVGLNQEELVWPHTTGSDPVGSCDVYRVTLDERLSDLRGRLVIEWGDSKKAWIQRADNQDKVVLELRDAFREDAFPGFTRFVYPLSKIERLPLTWVSALSASRGIYLLTCPRTKEQYVGSASGSEGLYGRWLSYARDGHGRNVGLKSRDPSDYQVSVLEVVGSSVTAEEIFGLEGLWKRKLQSREMGLNRN